MFLNELSEDAKKAFLDLALICAKADNVLDKKEEEILKIYCDEMGVERPEKTVKADYFVELFSEDRDKFNSELCDITLQISGKKEEHIVYFELCAMIYADGEVCELEQYILDYLSEELNDETVILQNSSRALLAQMDILKDIEILHKSIKG